MTACKPLKAVFALICLVCVGVTQLSNRAWGQEGIPQRITPQNPTTANSGAKRLDAGWTILATAASEVYYWNYIPSNGMRTRAISLLPALEDVGNAAQKGVARAAVDIFQQMGEAVSERAHSGLDPQSNRKRVEDFSLKAFFDPDNADQTYYDTIFGGPLEAANAHAIADQKVKQQEAALRTLWGEQILPPLRVAAGPNTEGKPVEMQIGVDDLYLWMRAANTSNHTLHNCTLILNFGLGTSGPLYPPMAIFVPEWPAGKTLFAPFFESQSHITGTNRPGGMPRMRAGYELWSDEAHTPPQSPTLQNGWNLRYEFFSRLFQSGARYGCKTEGGLNTIEFGPLTRRAQGYGVTAIVRIAQSGRPATAETFTGEWQLDPPRNLFTMSNAKTISFHMDGSARSAPLASTGFGGARSIQQRGKSLSVAWRDGSLRVTVGSSYIDEQTLNFIALPRRRSVNDGDSSAASRRILEEANHEAKSQTADSSGKPLPPDDNIARHNPPNMESKAAFPSIAVNKPDTYNIFIGDTPEDTLAANGKSYATQVFQAQLNLNAKYYPATSKDAICDYIKRLPVRSRINLIGHGYGGAIAADIALHFTSYCGKDVTLNVLVTVDPISEPHPNYKDLQRATPFWVNIIADPNDHSEADLLVWDKRWGLGAHRYASLDVRASPLHHTDFDAMMKCKGNDGRSALDTLLSH